MISDRISEGTTRRQALFVLDAALAARLAHLDEAGARRLVYALGPEASRRRAVALLALCPRALASARMLAATADHWHAPRLPVGGGDLIRRGLRPGPRIGAVLAELEAWWVSNDFPDTPAVQARLQALLDGTALTQ